MKTNKTELVFLLDRSGSMAGLEEDTIGGYNSMLKKQKQEKMRTKDKNYYVTAKKIVTADIKEQPFT